MYVCNVRMYVCRQKLDLAIAEGRLKILIVALQGHLFFGNIQSVVEKIQGYLPVVILADVCMYVCMY